MGNLVFFLSVSMQLLASLATDIQDIYGVSFWQKTITSRGASINKRTYDGAS